MAQPTQAKDNFLKRLFGTPGQNTKSKYREMQEWQPQTDNLFGANDNVLGFLGGQEQPQQPQQQPSKYQLYQLMQEKPTRDTEQEDIIKKRAKVNALSKGFSGLAGLAGMAIGGDAPNVPDYVSPFNENQIQTLDQDYRRRLEDWVNKGFQVDQANTGLANQEIKQGIDAENRMNEIGERAKNAMEMLRAKSFEEQAKDMRDLGIDINSPGAYEQFLKLMQEDRDIANRYTQAKTKWNLRNPAAGRSGSGKELEDFDIPTLTKGRNQRMSQLKTQRQAELNETNSRLDKEAINKKYDQLEEEVRKYKPGVNPLIDAEMMQYGTMGEEDGWNPEQGGQPQKQRSMNFDQGRGMFTNVPANQDPVIKTRLENSFKKAFEGTLEQEELIQMIQDLVNSGDAQDEEEAYQLIEEYIQDQVKK